MPTASTSATSIGAFSDLRLDHVELYVGDLDGETSRWTSHYGFQQAAAGGSPEQGFRSVLLRQGQIALVLTEGTSPDHPAHTYVRAHGDGVANLALRTPDAVRAYAEAVRRGAQPTAEPTRAAGVVTAAVAAGLGDITLTLVEREHVDGAGIPVGFHPLESAPPADGAGLLEIDHVAVCVRAGELDTSVAFYEHVLDFEEIFEERIVVGNQAMLSKVVQSSSGEITLTIIQPDPTAKPGQIDEFLESHGGSGIQHIAFSTEDVVRSVETLSGRDVDFLTTPGAYYDLLAQRISLTSHRLDELSELNILVDEDHSGQLFQIFTRTTHPRRTLFFEVIERLGAKSFGSSNIKALYEAVELERQRNRNQSL